MRNATRKFRPGASRRVQGQHEHAPAQTPQGQDCRFAPSCERAHHAPRTVALPVVPRRRPEPFSLLQDVPVGKLLLARAVEAAGLRLRAKRALLFKLPGRFAIAQQGRQRPPVPDGRLQRHAKGRQAMLLAQLWKSLELDGRRRIGVQPQNHAIQAAQRGQLLQHIRR